MKTTKSTLDKIAEFEGIRLKAYKCPAGVWTIGVGHTGGVTEGMTITRDQAMAFFEEDIQKFEKAVDALGRPWTQNQYDALVSFAYNCGAGNLKKLVGNRDNQQIADAMLLYTKGGGKVLPGLVRRRKWEHDLFLSGSEEKKTGNPYSPPTKTLKRGSKGSGVSWLQYELNQRGAKLIVDGKFGQKTEDEVRAYQNRRALISDGIVGPVTRAELIAGK